MAGFDTGTGTQLVRANVWDAQLKEVLLDDLMAMKYIDWISGFGDGTTLNIPSVGQADVDNYLEDTAIKYRAMDTGNFTMTITEYLQAGTYITNKMKQDSFYTDRLVASFVPNQHRALMERVETDILYLAMSQTTSDPNTINGADHRWVGAGTSETMSTADFAKALLALQKARVPMTNLIAIVDPSVEHTFNTITNLTNFSNNPMWEGIVADGIASGMRFTKNVYGFDVYVSNYLPTANETITSNGTARTTGAGKANLFFSAAGGDLGPFKGAWRQMPKVDTKYNMDMQRDEYATTARYGVKLYREENLVVVLTDTDQVG
jgi:hypothetical protein